MSNGGGDREHLDKERLEAIRDFLNEAKFRQRELALAEERDPVAQTRREAMQAAVGEVPEEGPGLPVGIAFRPFDLSVAARVVNETSGRIAERRSRELGVPLTSLNHAAIAAFVLYNLFAERAEGEWIDPPDLDVSFDIRNTATPIIDRVESEIERFPDAPDLTTRLHRVADAALAEGRISQDVHTAVYNPSAAPRLGVDDEVVTWVSGVIRGMESIVRESTDHDGRDFAVAVRNAIEAESPEQLREGESIIPIQPGPGALRVEKRREDLVEDWAETGSIEEAVNRFFRGDGVFIDDDDDDQKQVLGDITEALKTEQAAFVRENPGATDQEVADHLLSFMPQQPGEAAALLESQRDRVRATRIAAEDAEEAQKQAAEAQTPSGAKKQFNQVLFEEGFTRADFRDEDLLQSERSLAAHGGATPAFREAFSEAIPAFQTAKASEDFMEGGADSIERLLITMGIGGRVDDEFQQALRKNVIPELVPAFADAAQRAPFSFDPEAVARRAFSQVGITPTGELAPALRDEPPRAFVGELGEVVVPEEPGFVAAARERRRPEFARQAFIEQRDPSRPPTLPGLPGFNVAAPVPLVAEGKFAGPLRDLAETPEELAFLLTQVPELQQEFRAEQRARRTTPVVTEEMGRGFQAQLQGIRGRLTAEDIGRPGEEFPLSPEQRGLLERQQANLERIMVGAGVRTQPALDLGEFVEGKRTQLRSAFAQSPTGMRVAERQEAERKREARRAASQEEAARRRRLRSPGRTTFQRTFG